MVLVTVINASHDYPREYMFFMEPWANYVSTAVLIRKAFTPHDRKAEHKEKWEQSWHILILFSESLLDLIFFILIR